MRESVRFAAALMLCVVLSLSGGLVVVAPAQAAETSSWTEHSLVGLDVMCLAIDPSLSTTVYAGSWSSGVFRSRDRGTTWTPMNNGLTNLAVFSLAIDPLVPTTLYAGTADGVFRSNDSGAWWTAGNAGLDGEHVLALAIDFNTPSALYAGTWGDGVFRSTDSGSTWTAVEYGSTDQWVGSLAIDPLVPTTLYAGTADGVFRSSDGGSHWTAASAGLTNREVRSLGINPLTPATLYAGTDGGGVFSSTNGGTTWTAMNAGLANVNVLCLAINALTPATLYVGTDGGGVFSSTDGGTTWTAMNAGLTNMNVQCLAINPLIPATLYAGTYYGGVYRHDAPASYVLTTAASPSSGGSVIVFPDDASYASGSIVTLAGIPAYGYVFTGWTDDATGMTNPVAVSMTSNKTVTATFAAMPMYTLSLSSSPSSGGSIASDPDQSSYLSGAVVAVAATSTEGYTFTEWLGDLMGSANPTIITMNANKTIMATFSATPAPVDLVLSSSWNLVSVAVPLPVSSITGLQAVFGYHDGWSVPTTLTPGEAYWVQGQNAVTVPLPGTPSTAPVSLTYQASWQLLGNPFDVPLPISSITNHGYITTCYLYGSAWGTVDVTSGVLEPGKGYWILLSASTTLTLTHP